MKALRIAWTVVSLLLAQAAVCGLSSVPVVLLWQWLVWLSAGRPLLRLSLFSAAIVPSYLLFTLALLFTFPVALRLLGWRTPPDSEMGIAGCGWPLLTWVRYAACLHLARLTGGHLLKGTPVWTAHLRLCGARLGRRVYVNSVFISDYNLITCGDDVVIGDGVHLSGHTVEAGVVKTAPVVLGSHVTVGLGSVIDIDVEVGSNAQIGALSFVPKHSRLQGNAVYAGIPLRRLRSIAAAG